MEDRDVTIVGAGLAGLSCALHLQERGLTVGIIEASDGVGGRQRTDALHGFLLDRGFHVLQMAYPEALHGLDYRSLDLRTFYDGALVRYDGRFHRLSDPFRRPRHALGALLSPLGTLGDKLRVARLRRRLLSDPPASVFPETSTLEALRLWGFSDAIIDRFFRPFLGGVFLDGDLRTTSRMFEFVFRHFAGGPCALPARGIGSIPAQLASRLAAGSIRLGRRAVRAGGREVVLDSGETIRSGAVALAVPADEAARLTGSIRPTGWRGVTCLYFAAPEPPIAEPILVLDGEGSGPVNNLCVPSLVAPSYAPERQCLISASVLGSADGDEGDLERRVRDQMSRWFGSAVDRWRHLRTYRIPHALPEPAPSKGAGASAGERVPSGVFLCGDYTETGSIHGAMLSGRRAAESIVGHPAPEKGRRDPLLGLLPGADRAQRSPSATG